MQGRRQKHLVLILARQFAENLATPVFVADNEGNLVFYNEAAEVLLGRTYAEAGEMPAAEWGSLFKVKRMDGSPMPLEQMPAGIALIERRPAHDTFLITGLDGEERAISVTGLPLSTRPDESLGVVAIFWEAPEA